LTVTAPAEVTPGRTPSGRRKRADAVRNRDAVVAAASDVFAERGLDAGIPDIAERAGVGKGTVYRSFPTKDHLIAAVVVERLQVFRARLEEAAGEPDAWIALRTTILERLDKALSDRVFYEGLSRTIDAPEVQQARAEVRVELGKIVRRAQEQGTMRTDVVAEDLPVLVSGVSSVLAEDPDTAPATWRRYLTLALDALRPEGAEPLPGTPARPEARRRRVPPASG
jgi:AcrR family transcriptional regulator